MLRPIFTLRINKRPVTLGKRTLVMGVLNVTPDSFSDSGLHLDPDSAVKHGLAMARQGADWIDVGGESTRPGSRRVEAGEELARVLPVIGRLHHEAPALPISIDTTRAEVAEAALQAGAAIINDVSGLRFDPELAEVARRRHAPLILMHLRGRPETMQRRPFARDIARSLGRGLAWSVRQALERGARRSQLLIDPGLGFGKTRRQNYEILSDLRRLHRFGLPLVVGSSRKSFIQAIAAGEGLDPDRGGQPSPRRDKSVSALGPTLRVADAAAVAAAILAGAHVVRVHEVAALMPAVRIADAILAAE